jgi:hypothetical protein
VLSAKVKLMALQEGLLELETDTAEAVDGLVSEFDRALSEMAAANKLQYNAYFTQVWCVCLWACAGRAARTAESGAARCPPSRHAASGHQPHAHTPAARAPTRAHAQVRDLQNSFFLGLAAAVPTYLERYGGGGALGGPGGVGGVCGVGAGCDNPELDGLPEEVQLMLGDRDALLNAIQVRVGVCGCEWDVLWGGGGRCARCGVSEGACPHVWARVQKLVVSDTSTHRWRARNDTPHK